MIIAAHAGTGKTTLARMFPETVTDFVCMPYKYYLPETVEYDEANKANPNLVMHDDWPFNYIDAIKNVQNDNKFLLIPPVWVVLFHLQMDKIPYLLCYPRRDAKEIYRQRYIERGNSEDFLSIFIDGWDNFMDAFEADTYGQHIVLEPHQFLSDVLSV
jgi:hypothetical protein